MDRPATADLRAGIQTEIALDQLLGSTAHELHELARELRELGANTLEAMLVRSDDRDAALTAATELDACVAPLERLSEREYCAHVVLEDFLPSYSDSRGGRLHAATLALERAERTLLRYCEELGERLHSEPPARQVAPESAADLLQDGLRDELGERALERRLIAKERDAAERHERRAQHRQRRRAAWLGDAKEALAVIDAVRETVAGIELPEALTRSQQLARERRHAELEAGRRAKRAAEQKALVARLRHEAILQLQTFERRLNALPRAERERIAVSPTGAPDAIVLVALTPRADGGRRRSLHITAHVDESDPDNPTLRWSLHDTVLPRAQAVWHDQWAEAEHAAVSWLLDELGREEPAP